MKFIALDVLIEGTDEDVCEYTVALDKIVYFVPLAEHEKTRSLVQVQGESTEFAVRHSARELKEHIKKLIEDNEVFG